MRFPKYVFIFGLDLIFFFSGVLPIPLLMVNKSTYSWIADCIKLLRFVQFTGDLPNGSPHFVEVCLVEVFGFSGFSNLFQNEMMHSFTNRCVIVEFNS